MIFSAEFRSGRAKSVLSGLLLVHCFAAAGDHLGDLCADRTALERVYYNHRTGNKPAFEQLLPPSAIEGLVKLDLKKERTLKKVYGIEILTAQVAAEVDRIHNTTRAPEMLAELKKALGNDSKFFARSVARPIVVERELRTRFENDDKLHASQRQKAEKMREELLAAKINRVPVDKLLALLKENKAGTVSDVTWQLTPRENRESGSAEQGGSATSALPSPSTKSAGGIYSVEATAQVAWEPSSDRKTYFEDLPGDLQKVLRVQLQKYGDVSAVIETPSGFLLVVAKEKTAQVLHAASLSIPKRGYEEWLEEQSN